MIDKFIAVVVTLFWTALVSAYQDPTQGKPFLPWLWQDQLTPTIEVAGKKNNLLLLAGGMAIAGLASGSDDSVAIHSRESIDPEHSKWGALLGSGAPGLAIAAGQIYFDTNQGLAHARAIMLTSITHISTALIVQRERPNGNRLSFPSGHTSSSFATATALAYSYGPKVGIPALLVATFVGASRVSDGAHWLSDVVGGAALGIYWAKASADFEHQEASNLVILPILSREEFKLSLNYRF